MPQLSAPTNSAITKMIILGSSGTGKTGALASLVNAGYKLRILDMDNKIQGGILPILVQRDCSDKMANVQYESLRDKWKASAIGHMPDGMPTAYTKALALMDKWSDGTIPKTWGPDHIFVLDSLTFFADAAFNWAQAMNPSSKDPRQWYWTAQQGVLHTLDVLTSDEFKANVIVIAHVAYEKFPDGSMKGLPAAIGSAIDKDVPTYFENMAMTQIVGGKRTIQTAPTALVDLKNPASFKMLPTLPIETGLADFFKTLRA